MKNSRQLRTLLAQANVLEVIDQYYPNAHYYFDQLAAPFQASTLRLVQHCIEVQTDEDFRFLCHIFGFGMQAVVSGWVQPLGVSGTYQVLDGDQSYAVWVGQYECTCPEATHDPNIPDRCRHYAAAHIVDLALHD